MAEHSQSTPLDCSTSCETLSSSAPSARWTLNHVEGAGTSLTGGAEWGDWTCGSCRLCASTAAAGGVAHSKEESEPEDDGEEAIDGERLDSVAALTSLDCDIPSVELIDEVEKRTVDG